MPQANNSQKLSVLVIGGDGQIGRALFTELKSFGFSTTRTTRRPVKPDEHTLHLDLSSPALFENSRPHDVAFICAGVTSIAACERNQEKTWEINVTRTIELIQQLSRSNTHIIYLSSTAVFSGRKPHVSTHEKQEPECVYGKQKQAVENYLRELNGKTATLRLSKVIGPSFPLLTQWVTKLRNAEPINAYNDMVFSPVSLSTVVSACAKLASQKLTGTFHLSGIEDISYSDLARFLARQLNVSLELVDRINVNDSTQEIFSNPVHTTLDTTSSLEHLGFEPQKWTDVVEHWLDNHEV